MKRICFFVILVFILASLAACAPGKSVSTPEPTNEPTQEMTPTPAPAVSISPVPTATPEQKLSYTTGLPFDGPYKPVMTVIENSPAARPQTGLQTADVVYEVPVEGSITRFVCVFSDTVPEEILPVRSARVPFLYIQTEWDGILMHFGAAGRKKSQWSKDYSVYGHELYGKIELVLDGITGKWNDYFYRTTASKAPHNVVGKPLLVQKLYDYDPTPPGWKFDSSYSYEGETVQEFNLEMCSNDKDFISYSYDAANDVYLRSMNNKPFIAAETGEQIHVKNIIVQHTSYRTVEKGRKLFKLVGEGDADYYIGGKLIHGTWERESEDGRTLFKDDKGNQIILSPGNTWVHIT